MTATLFLGVWLASFRVTRLVVRDSITLPLRKQLFKRFPPNGDYAKLSGKKVSKVGEIFDCPWCVGFWLSGLGILLTMAYVPVALPVLWWLAVSAAVGLTASKLDG